MIDDTLVNKILLPIQIVPLPVYPKLQEQLKDPAVFMQSASL